jgi:hypothetical protein
MRCIFLIAILVSVINTGAQTWAPVSLDKFNTVVERVFYDPVHDQLIANSKFVNHIGNLSVRGVASWNGIKWDSLAGGINTHDKVFNPTNPSGLLLTGISYNGALLAGGSFVSVGDVNTTSIALWNGTKWDSLPKRAFRYGKYVTVSGFLKKNTEVYIHGDFDTIAGQLSNGLAKWDGVNFTSIPLPVTSGFQGIWAMIEYQNELYITGGIFNFGATQARDILKFNGVSWVSTTGGGLKGGYASVGDFIIYNNELYASGHFTKAEGNPANNIMKWDGAQWKDIGFGNTPAFIAINKMLVYQNKLWVFGTFDKVAGGFASKIAVYDGINWCASTDTINNNLESAVVYRDTIYLGGYFNKINSDSIKYMTKLKNPSNYNNCINVGINETKLSETIKIYPNPTTSSLHILDEQNELSNSSIEISNSIGQTIVQMPFSSSIDISTLPEGCYFIIITTSQKSVLRTKFIKE